MTMTEKVEHTELPWSVWVEPIADADQAKKELGLLVEGTPDFRPHLVYLCGPNNLAPAVTGCGEKSIANAEYIVLACNSYPALLAERERLREALEEIRDSKFCSYENTSADSYGTGVTDGHRFCANIARAALKDTNQ